MNGDGTAWETVDIFASGFDDSPLTYQGDFDHDGDVDFALVTHFGGRVAWASNDDGKGKFSLHMLATVKDFLHTIVAAARARGFGMTLQPRENDWLVARV